MEAITDNYYALYIYLDAFWRRRYLIVTCILITPFLALLSATLLPKTYKASISIAINKIETPSLKDVSSTIDITQQFAGVKAYLSSPSVLEKIVVETNLVPADSSEKTVQQAADELKKKLKITLVGEDVVQIDLSQNTPNYLSIILNTLGNKLIERLNAQNLSVTNSSLIVLENELKNQEETTNKSIDALNHYIDAHADLTPAYRDIYFARLREITSELGENKIQYNTTLTEQKELYGMIVKLNPQIGQIENAILENDNKLFVMRLTYTDNFPGVKALIQLGESLRAERDKLYKQYQNIDDNTIQALWNMAIVPPNNKNGQPNPTLTSQLEKLRNMQLKTKGLSQQINDLTNQQKDINKKLRLIDTTSKTITKLNQTVKNNQNAYNDLLTRYNLLKMTLNLNKTNGSRSAQIVAYPQKPIKSLARPPLFFFVIGIFSGIFLGFGLAIIFEFMDNTVRRRRDIEAIGDVKVICRVETLA
ncbi:hypothetical protein DGG96_10360 [Legionella qingyii]|uniref:Polysaccharide chain length determinant N-terminal domain-containing protein n=1 Tax=Legionella qingyii TaxID=2184757 RepID=A0A317U4E4_9GAMM|nr:Wzz/FepE/Etk N-terminal domain-containing protein [Legionella qingyii]PWY55687.1 hypothetical protein DGG96_10360 [Legionella qingyii]RUR21645.1 hypothetical protein ELY20_11855 [Legionella qingyii]RUR25087.1 hypothetical protein ELY16_10515 [Legionella qingyii]